MSNLPKWAKMAATKCYRFQLSKFLYPNCHQKNSPCNRNKVLQQLIVYRILTMQHENFSLTYYFVKVCYFSAKLKIDARMNKDTYPQVMSGHHSSIWIPRVFVNTIKTKYSRQTFLFSFGTKAE